MNQSVSQPVIWTTDSTIPAFKQNWFATKCCTFVLSTHAWSYKYTRLLEVYVTILSCTLFS